MIYITQLVVKENTKETKCTVLVKERSKVGLLGAKLEEKGYENEKYCLRRRVQSLILHLHLHFQTVDIYVAISRRVESCWLCVFDRKISLETLLLI